MVTSSLLSTLIFSYSTLKSVRFHRYLDAHACCILYYFNRICLFFLAILKQQPKSVVWAYVCMYVFVCSWVLQVDGPAPWGWRHYSKKVQGCALAEPCDPCCLTYAPGWLENLTFFPANHMLDTLNFTVRFRVLGSLVIFGTNEILA